MYNNLTKAKAIVHYKYFELSLRKVAKTHGVSKSSLQRWIHESGNKIRKRVTKNKKLTVISNEITNIITHNPFITSSQIAQHIYNKCNIRISRSTAHRTLKSLNYTYKKTHRVINYNYKRDQVYEFSKNYLLNRKNIICIDESYFYVGDFKRRGYSPKGSRLHARVGSTVRRTKYTLIMAISEEGIIKFDISTKNCNTNKFYEFVNDLMVPEKSVLVMDNVAFHHSTKITDLIKSKKWISLFIPPYSPKVNAIEYIFGIIKNKYRSICVVNDIKDHVNIIVKIIDDLKNTKLTKIFNHVDKFIIEALNTNGDKFFGYE